MNVTRAEIEAARNPACAWSATELAAAVAARFPGTAPVDLGALIAQWLADASLSRGTLSQCAVIAARLAGVSAAGSMLDPQAKLTAVAAGL